MLLRLRIVGLSLLLITTQLWGIDKGTEAFKRKQYRQAIEEWQQILKAHPELKSVYYNQGEAYYQLGDLEKSRAAFEKALSTRDTSLLADAFYNLGNLFVAKRDFEQARKMYKKVLKLRPYDQDAKANLELINRLPPPPPQQQQRQSNQSDSEQNRQQKQQNQQSQSKQRQKQNQSQQSQREQKQERSQGIKSQQRKGETRKPQEAQRKKEAQEAQKLRDLQILTGLENREVQNLKKLIRAQTAGEYLEKDW